MALLWTVNGLPRMDRLVKVTIRQWFTLRNDTSTGYFHTTVGKRDLRISLVR